MSMLRKDGNFPSTSCATSQEAQESSFAGQSPVSALKVTLLSSEWRSTKGGLSTINRELAIQLAKHSNVEVSMYLPQCSEEDKRAAAAHNVCIIEAKEKPGYDPIDWLATIPREHQMDFVIGHGIHLGRQVPLIKEVHQECKWIQVVHTDPEELGMFKNCPDSIAQGEKKHQAEVKLCELADQVVAIGPKLAEAFSSYLRSCGKDQDVLDLTPGIFSEFASVPQAAEERRIFRVLVFGSGDSEDFYLKGCDIAACAVAELCKLEPHRFKLVFVGAPKGEEKKVKELLLKEGIAPSQLVVRSYKEREELGAQFCEADLTIMPSRSEGFGLAALEALSAGVPVRVSSNSGFGDALKKLSFGWTCIVNSEDASEWAKAARTILGIERKLRLGEALKIRESYAEKYHWEGECGRLVERMLYIMQDTSTARDQASAVNLGEQGPSSVSESVSYSDATTIHDIVDDAVSSGRENVIQGERARTHPLTTTEGREELNAGIPEISPERQFADKQGKRPAFAHHSSSPPGKKQRRDTDTIRVFNDNSVVVKLLRAEYNRRAQFNPLLWDDAVKLPLENVYTRLKIVSRWKPGSDTDEVNPCDIFGVLKKGDDPMILIEGSPGIGKTTFCLKLAYDWANQSSVASFPEFELVLLLKCRDIDGELTEAITEQLFPKDMSKHAGEELLRFMEDIPNQEKVLIVLDGLDELPEKSRPQVDLFLRRRILSFCYVLTTTRQEKGIEARKQFAFDIVLKIEGFTEGDSFEYIKRHFKNVGPGHSSKGEKLIEEIKDNELLRDLQKNPLHLLLLCVVYQDHKGKLPSSRTDLYQVIVVSLLRRYCARHNVKASKEDMGLEKQFKRDIRCLGELAWNCLLSDRHSFFEEELEELERRNEKLVARRLGFVYKEESLKVLKHQHEYCFLHKSFQEYLAASYVARKLRRNKLNVFEHLSFDAVVNKFPQVFIFVCGILRERAHILFAQIGEKLKSDWDWHECSEAEAKFFIDSWSESGNAEGMANTLFSFIPFPRFARLFRHASAYDFTDEELNLLRVLLFCRTFSEVRTPDEIHLEIPFSRPLLGSKIIVRDLAYLPNLKSLDFSRCDMDVELAHELFQSLPDFASLTELELTRLPYATDWEIVAEALRASKTLEKVTFSLCGERGDGWARALGAGLCADTPLSFVNLTICDPMSETALQALENLLLNKSLSSVSLVVKGDMSYSLAVILSKALAGETAVKSLELRDLTLSFCCANLIERGIVKNNSLSNFECRLRGELPDNWQAIVENLNAQLAEKSSVIFEVYPNSFSPVTAIQLRDVSPYGIDYGPLEPEESVTLNVWGELIVDDAEALYDVLLLGCHMTLNIHGKLTDDFLQCLARAVDHDEEEPLCSVTINTWDQLTNEGRAIFKELELDKNPAVTLNVCELQEKPFCPITINTWGQLSNEGKAIFKKNPAVTLNVCEKHVPSDKSDDNEIESIDDPESLIALFVEAENTGKENLTVTINVQSDDSSYDYIADSTCDDSDDSTGRSWIDILHLGCGRNCSLNSLSLTINNFRPWSTRLSLTLIDCLEGCSSLKSLILTLNEYHGWKDNYASRLRKGLGRNTSLISLTLTLNIYRIIRREDDDWYDAIYGPITSVDSFTLTVSNCTGSDSWGLNIDPLLSDFKSLTTLNVTLNRCGDFVDEGLPDLLVEAIKTNSLRTLRLKFNDLSYEDFYIYGKSFSEWVVKVVNSPSPKVIELSFTRYGVVGSSLQTLKWEKQ
ncbi:PREDICTED: uncharacterized protein LOC107355669 [Acropora digitifera]|uniref:uncharacterized protein LOC107355669 n=1 Tax=Acropora digitifera TaxID=70779 RepID=UPI00077A6534|nr:PREDICTED: uncharacterized protein LOC107355669 [Acropora digitifera]